MATAAALLVLAGAGSALAVPPPWAHSGHRGHGAPSAGPRAHALISGTIVGIDYGSATILVATARGIVPVAVTPSTSIYRGSAFASFAEIGRGAHVDVDAADVEGHLVAQLIRIR
ncbi:MAG: hypothetical protein ABR508_06895 [Candidatus Baltobacteraceae bacterium]